MGGNTPRATEGSGSAIFFFLLEQQACPLSEWLLRLAWQLRIWHDLPYCVASARSDPESSMNPASSQLIETTRVLLHAAKSAGMAVKDVTAEDIFELVTTLSWGVDRFGDDEPAARKRVSIATVGIFRET